MVRAMLSESLRAGDFASLAKTKEVRADCAHRNHDCTPAIPHLIREAKVRNMYSGRYNGQAMGMQTLDQCWQILSRKIKSPLRKRVSKAANKDTSQADDQAWTLRRS